MRWLCDEKAREGHVVGVPERRVLIKMEETAMFAGGCFWCMVHPFDEVPGVHRVISGYTGGLIENPRYEDVCSGKTGHVEAVEITFDPDRVSYGQLLDMFWRQIDPTDDGGQFYDRGSSYRPVIFYVNERQRREAEESKGRLAASGRFSSPIVVDVRPATKFYPAEDYHQNFYRTHAAHYRQYRQASGRDLFLDRYWSDNRK